MRTRIPRSRKRRGEVWLDRANNPVGWRMEWVEGDAIVRNISGGVSPFWNFSELIARLDQLPRNVNMRSLEVLELAKPGNLRDATHRLKFEIPGWWDGGLWNVEETAWQPPLIS